MIQSKLKQINTIIRNNKLLLSILVNFALFSIIYLLFVPAFNTNDDVGMMLRVSGILKGSESTIFIMYSNIIIAYVLQFLYKFFGSVIWYELYHIFSLFIVHTTFLYIGLKSSAKKQNVLFIYLLYFLFAGSTLLLNIQFTIVATLLILSGLSLVFFPIYKKFNKWELFFGFLLIIFGSLVRSRSLYLAMGIFFPLIFTVLLSNKKNIVLKKVVLKFTIVFLALLSSFGFQKFNNYVYSKSGFPENQFYEYNTLRGKIMDYKVLNLYSNEDKLKILKSVNWSQNDLNMLNSWFFLDNNTYNISKLRKIINNKFEKKAIEKKITFDSFISLLNIYKDLNVQFIFFYFIIIILLFKIKLKELFILFSYLVFSIILLYFIYIMLKVPPFRVYINLFAFVGILPIFICKNLDFRQYLLSKTVDFNKKNTFPLKKIISNLFVLIFIVFALYKLIAYQIQESNKRIENNSVFKKLLVKLSDSNKIFINQGSAIYWENLAYLKSKKFLKNFSIINLGTANHTTYPYNMLKNAGISNLYLDLLYRDDIFYIANSRYAGYYRIFMKEHYNIDVIPFMTQKFNEIVIYKMLIADSILTNLNNYLNIEKNRTEPSSQQLPDSVIIKEFLKKNLIAYYPFNGDAYDKSGNNNHGLVFGAKLTYDKNNKKNSAYYFDGKSYIEIKNSSSLNPTKKMTISAWYKPEKNKGSGSDPIVTKGFIKHQTPYYQYHLSVTGLLYNEKNSGCINFSTSPAKIPIVVSTIKNSFKENEWLFITGVYDSGIVSLYVNGKLAISKGEKNDNILEDYGLNLLIGKGNNYEGYIKGTIDEVRIYNKALNPIEVYILYLQ